jgi:hypothetical protein
MIPRAERARLAAVAGLALLGCASPVWTPTPAPVQPFDCEGAGSTSHSVFLIGDAGAPRLPRDGSGLVDAVLRSLHRDVGERVAELGEDRVAVVFLGDNVYWDGLPPQGHRDRRRGERILEAQIAASDPARAIFLLGNHDWHIEGPEGWDRALAQRRFLERFAPRVEMRPPGGCPGPDRIDLGRYLRLVLIDPIGVAHLVAHPEEHRTACPDRSFVEAYLDLASEFDHPDGRHVGLVLHHPLITAGPHGGHFTWKQHIFPLTDFWPWAWLPLPVIGSAYPISRQLGVTGTDATSRDYDRWVRGIYRASRPLVPSFFVGGHEHSLQVHRDAVGAYYLVSGAGSAGKVDRVHEEMETLMMAAARPGYMRLDVHQDGSLGLTVLAADGDEPSEPVFRHCLAHGPPRAWRRPGSARSR